MLCWEEVRVFRRAKAKAGLDAVSDRLSGKQHSAKVRALWYNVAECISNVRVKLVCSLVSKE